MCVCFYSFWRLLDGIEAKIKSGNFLTKSKNRPQKPLPPGLWCALPKTTTFFYVDPYNYEKWFFLENETADRFTFGGILGDSNGTKGEYHLIESVTSL